MLEFSNIRIRAALPLHPYLAKYPRLSLKLVADEDVCEETPRVSGDLVTGTWTFNSMLSVPATKQSLTIAVTTGGKVARIPVSVTVKVAELLVRVKDRANACQDFDIFDSSAALQLKLFMSCSIKLFSILDGPSRAVSDRADHRRRKDTQSYFESGKIDLSSRRDLETLYARTIRMPDPVDNKARMLSLLGRSYYALYQKERGRPDLEKALSLHEEAMQFTGPFHPQLAEHARHFSEALTEKFQQSGDPVDIEQAISHCQTALKFTEDHDKDKPGLLNTLACAVGLRFERIGDLTDIENSISYQRRAVELTADGRPNKPTLLSNLGNALQLRFRRLGNLADIDDAILNHQKAVELTPARHPDKPAQLSNLGNALHSRFEHVGVVSDVDNAISNYERALELTPGGHPNKPRVLCNLGNALWSRFGRLGSLTDIDDAISNNSHPEKPSRFNNLGYTLRARFERLGNLADIDDAILVLRNAIELAPDGHPEKPTLLTNRGSALQCRFERLGSLADMDAAIFDCQKALELTPDGHPNKPRWLNNLGGAFQCRFRRLGSPADIESAIKNQKKAVEFMPDDHPDKAPCLSNLGNALRSQFERLGNLADIDDAISNQRKAVEFTPDGHPDKPGRLGNLGGSLQCRFGHIGSLADVEDAILNQQTAVELVPDGHPDTPGWLSNLGGGFLARFKLLGVHSDLESALSALSTAAKSISGSAMVRFDAARTWAKVAEEYSRSPLDAFNCAIDLLPRIAWLGLAVTDQHALLADVGGVVRDAVAAAIRYKEHETAVVWAEQGRSIVWQNLLGLRSPVDELRRAHPRLADRLQNIARQLEGSGSRDNLGNEGQSVPVEDTSRGYSKLAFEWDNLVNEIRRIPDFEGFLRPKRFSQLAPAAHEGPVVILNVNDSQCDALVLIADDSPERHVSVVNISLERFSYDKSKKLFQALTGLLKSAGVRERSDRKMGRAQSQADDEAKFKRILRILWQDVVKPVIEGLALQTEPKRPPRIWWCATGLLAFLPIHAAGLYDTPDIGEKVSDYVVSSYTPTLTAILELSEPAVQEDFQVLMVAQASAPDASPIPKTEDEVRIVHRLTTGAQRVSLMRENATVERVREGMMESDWIHLACHGQQNRDDPMESGFLLRDKILKLSEIVQISLPKADFAFLSACQTAMGDERVAEESVHLAAGMFLSGCRGVIATTWSIRDDDAPKITEDVYSRIFEDGKPNRKEAAYALHEAVRRLRESGAHCTSWVPFIHIGR